MFEKFRKKRELKRVARLFGLTKRQSREFEDSELSERYFEIYDIADRQVEKMMFENFGK